MSDLPSATQPDLSAAIDALNVAIEEFAHCSDAATVVPFTGFTLGHLRQIAAALAAPYVPGMVEVDDEAWTDLPEPANCAKLSIWPGSIGNWREDRYFAAPAVQS